MNPFGKLLEATIDRLWVSENQHELKFTSYVSWRDPEDHPILIVQTDGDCCSETWFADIIGVQNLLKEKVIAVEILELPDFQQDERCRQDIDDPYGVRIKTKKGDCDIIYRNSSNGYYSGEAFEYTKEDKFVWKEITEDWQA